MRPGFLLRCTTAVLTENTLFEIDSLLGKELPRRSPPHGYYDRHRRYGHYGRYRSYGYGYGYGWYGTYGYYGGGCGWLYRNAVATAAPIGGAASKRALATIEPERAYSPKQRSPRPSDPSGCRNQR